VHFFQAETETLSASLVDLSQLDKSRLTKEGSIILEILENDLGFGCHREYQKFKWMVLAYIAVQDSFPPVLNMDQQDGDEKVMFALYYFYYEALSILREFIYCGLNNMMISARHLI